MYLKYLIRDI